MIFMVKKFVIKERFFGEGKRTPDAIDIVDTANVFLLGPNAAIRESNRKSAQKSFRREFKLFGFDPDRL